jgi:hypothetical protein
MEWIRTSLGSFARFAWLYNKGAVVKSVLVSIMCKSSGSYLEYFT